MRDAFEKFNLTKGMLSKDLKTAALAYAQYGLPIFPVFGISKGKCLCGNNKCEAQGKHPIIKGGFKNATTDLKQIKKWWDQYPQANIGSALIPGLFALDFDGKRGRETYKELGFDDFESLRSKTGKGFHVLVHGDLKAKNNAKPGLDIRGGGEGGYVILPPSLHIKKHSLSYVSHSTPLF
ncbi:MAG: hypothetical protein DYH13_05285 [Alphaproteobacteria bacterium PRO2]|nr:hypothetical protein [Alphaproteobacteria bacterium PRO2]